MENIKVFVCDNDSFVINECSKVLNSNVKMIGYAQDGADCLEKIWKTDFDILLIDITLPKIDGLSVLQKISEMPHNFKTVVISAMNSSFVVEKASQLGASYFISKPLSYGTLPSTLASVWHDKSISYPMIMSRTAQPSKSLDEKIANIFMTIGIPPHIRGYSYLREAIKLAVLRPSIISSITKELYPSVARIMDSSPSKVERAIRHAIDVAWTRGKSEKLGGVLGVKVYVTMKPTNGEFIALIADKLLLESI